VRIVLDDFGTGYSSLSYLRRLPLDAVKLDRSFVSRLDESLTDRQIVAAVVQLARALQMTVVAEGVETAGQLAALRQLGCHLAQGYHLARPMTPEDLAATLGVRPAS
jgi:EAL domain-containing protein (putative c-di-GMP-specific phosphodiesterase class I)